jgi:hypothetical protein
MLIASINKKSDWFGVKLNQSLFYFGKLRIASVSRQRTTQGQFTNP